jgi:hypothetical protein
MRLLRASADDDDFTLVEFVHNIPKYAILSHTWGADEAEVTFEDICKGKGKGKKKPGYAKLRFCATQAAKDDLQFFWVDACCIDKSSGAELSEVGNVAVRSPCETYTNFVHAPFRLSTQCIRSMRAQQDATSIFPIFPVAS